MTAQPKKQQSLFGPLGRRTAPVRHRRRHGSRRPEDRQCGPSGSQRTKVVRDVGSPGPVAERCVQVGRFGRENVICRVLIFEQRNKPNICQNKRWVDLI